MLTVMVRQWRWAFVALLIGFSLWAISSGAVASTAMSPPTQSDDTPDTGIADTLFALFADNLSDSGLTPVEHPDGSVSLDLQGRFLQVPVAKIGEGGELIVGEVDNFAEAGAFFGLDTVLLEEARGRGKITNSPSLADLAQSWKQNAQPRTSAAPGNASIVIVNGDAPGVGFNDPTAVAPVGGNPGTTLGEQRLFLFQQAASIWAQTLDTDVQVRILAQFSPLFCDPFAGAVLGSAGTSSIFRDFNGVDNHPGAAFPYTWYHSALADKLAGQDAIPSAPDIVTFFNSSIDEACLGPNTGWYYGVDNQPPDTQFNFLVVLLHELAHGLGFANFTNEATGQFFNGLPSIYDRFTLDLQQDKHWDEMSVQERVVSAVTPRGVAWDGPNVSAQVENFLAPGYPQLTVLSPNDIAGTYEIGAANFGPSIESAPVTGSVTLAEDGVGSNTDGCEPLTNSEVITGTIALIDRGNCSFVTKVANAQAAGAIGVIVVNNDFLGFGTMGGSDPTIMIPSVMVSGQTGGILKSILLYEDVEVELGVDSERLAGTSPDGQALLYSPNPVQPGSSMSHWDTSATPNLLMEPSINSDLPQAQPLDLTAALMRDIGWYPDANLDGSPDDLADLQISMQVDKTEVAPGDSLSYTIIVSNTGVVSATDSVVVDLLPAQLILPEWTASYTGGATGPISDTQNLDVLIDLPPGSTATFLLSARVNDINGTVINEAGVFAPAGVTDPPHNNRARALSVIARPRIQVNPQSVQGVAPLGQTATHSLTIRNAGTLSLNVEVFESPAARAGEPRQSDASGLIDGGFEIGFPHPKWSETSDQKPTLFCTSGTCPGGFPASGDWFVQFGGTANPESAWLSQEIRISADTPVLEFDLDLLNCDSESDNLEVRIDNRPVYTVYGDSSQCGLSGYSRQMVDIRAFADDGDHLLSFHSQVFLGQGRATSFFVDNVAFTPPTLCQPGDIPWIAGDQPIVGFVPPGLSGVLDLRFDASYLDFGNYKGNICLATNDPERSLVRVPVEVQVVDAPRTAGQSLQVAEDTPNDTVIGEMPVFDLDQNDSHTFAIVGGNASAAFAVDPDSGLIRVADSSQLNYEVRPQETFTVAVTDSFGFSASAGVVVDVSNVVEVSAIELTATPAMPVVGRPISVTALITDLAGSPDVGRLVTFTDGSLAADLSGANEIPTPITNTTGSGRLVLTFDPATNRADYSLDVTGLVSVTQAHLHRGVAGVNGPVAYWLYDPNGVKAPSGAFPVTGTFTVTASDIPLLLSGGLYANVHTAANPGGELRGQLSGAKEATTGEDGKATVAWQSDQTALRLWAIADTLVKQIDIQLWRQFFLPSIQN